MLGIEILNKTYIENTIAPGVKIEGNNKTYIVEKIKSGNALRECVSAPTTGKMVHNLPFSELLDFLNAEYHILTQFTFNQAAKRNRVMKPSILDDVEYMNLKEALAYLSSISDAKLLKKLLEDNVWYA